MGYNWVPLTEDFDKSLAIKKWRYDVNNSMGAKYGNYDCALAEIPNVDIQDCWGFPAPENGYAFDNRFNIGQNYFSSRYYGFTDGFWTDTASSHTQLVQGTVYEFDCPVDLYWAGNYSTPWDDEISDIVSFYVEASVFEVDTTEIAAESGGSAYTVSVSADTGTSWTAATSASWVTITSATGEGNGSFVVTVAENDTYEPRDTVVELSSSDGDLITIAVTQVKKPVLIERHQIYRSGNMVNKMYRSGELIYQNIYEPTPEPEPEYSAMTVGFEIISGGSITWETDNGDTPATIYASVNDGAWQEMLAPLSVSAGDVVRFKGDNDRYYHERFADDGQLVYKVNGNIMSLIDSTGYTELMELDADNNSAFAGLFSGCTGLVDAGNLILPATALSVSCYIRMFQGCSGLVVAPRLPATALTSNCYERMFEFCTSLTEAPELPAPTLVTGCYSQMFYGCSSLAGIKCLANDISASSCAYFWVGSVAADGTFIKDGAMNDWTRGVNGIPNNWTVQDATV